MLCLIGLMKGDNHAKLVNQKRRAYYGQLGALILLSLVFFFSIHPSSMEKKKNAMTPLPLHYLPLPDSLSSSPSHTRSRKLFVFLVSLLAFTAIAAVFYSFHTHSSSSSFQSFGSPLPNVSSSPSFYTPKSKLPTALYHGQRSSSPWKYSSLRTAFHFQPQSNWMNDPNAPLYYKGWYHLFYQYNPNGAVWGLISWGHAVSADLIHWLYLDLAMVPDQWYDHNGVWTGSATFLHDGLPVIAYTGSTNESVQVQNLAVPEDQSDPLLRKWKKHPRNPILFPPIGIGKQDFRDPTTAWLSPDGLWRLGIGSKVGKAGVAIVFKSSDFQLWTQQEQFLHKVEGTGMWECLDFYPVPSSGKKIGLDTSAFGLNVKHVFKASLDETRVDHYVIGTYDAYNQTFIPDNPAQDLGYGLRYDYGKYYASKTFYDQVGQRRILWGWVNESDSQQDDIQKGWASLQAIPRQVWFDSKTKANLIQWPVDELVDLRRGKVVRKNMVLGGGVVVEIQGAEGAQLDIELSFKKPKINYSQIANLVDEEYKCDEGGVSQRGVFGPFGLLVLASDNLYEQTGVYFYITYHKGTWKTHVCSDESRSSLASDVDKSVYGSLVPVMEDEDKLSLRVVVDNSIVETYAQGGRTCVTSRVYPTLALDAAAHLFLFNNGTTPVIVESLEIWQMNRVYMQPF